MLIRTRARRTTLDWDISTPANFDKSGTPNKAGLGWKVGEISVSPDDLNVTAKIC
jgi:hypothetical protein